MGTGRFLSSSVGPEPFPGVPIKEPLQPQQPGEGLIRYELEAASGCSLNPLGWCCFGTLCCVALPLSWLPFVCAFCKQQCQRPVYGYPMDCLTVSFIAAAEDAWTKQKASTSPLPPSIHCMDSTLVESLAVQQDQGQWQQQQDACVALHMRCTPSPPPMSIFIPPSAVPACGFTADNPFPSRYNDRSPAGSMGGSPTAHLGFGAPNNLRTSSPMPGTGLPVVGMVDLEQHRRHLAMQEVQLAQQAAQQTAQQLAQQAAIIAAVES